MAVHHNAETMRPVPPLNSSNVPTSALLRTELSIYDEALCELGVLTEPEGKPRDASEATRAARMWEQTYVKEHGGRQPTAAQHAAFAARFRAAVISIRKMRWSVSQLISAPDAAELACVVCQQTSTAFALREDGKIVLALPVCSAACTRLLGQ